MKKINAIKDDSSKILTKIDKVEILLDRVSLVELKEFIFESVENDESFLNYFSVYFANYDNNESQKEYENYLKSIKKKHLSTVRYLEEYRVKNFKSDFDIFINIAIKHIEKNNHFSAFLISSAITKVMIDIYKKYTIPEFKVCIDLAFELIHDIAEINLTEDLRKKMFDFCLKSIKSNNFIYWDWHNDLIELAIHLNKTEKEILNLIESNNDSSKSVMESNVAQTYKYKLILKFMGEESANRYLDSNFKNPYIRKIIIENNLEKKNYDKAIQVAEFSIDYDKGDQNLVKMWHEYLLYGFVSTNNNQGIIKIARFLFLNHKGRYEEAYLLMKMNVLPEFWNQFIDDLIKELSTNNYEQKSEMIPNILIWEERWKDLAKVIERTIDYEKFQILRTLLLKYKHIEIVKIYKVEIIKFLHRFKGLDYYNFAKKGIIEMISTGFADVADELIKLLKSTFQNKYDLIYSLQEIESKEFIQSNS